MEKMGQDLSGRDREKVLNEVEFWQGEELPIVRQLELVSHCQLECHFCPKYFVGYGEVKGFIDVGLVEAFIDKRWLDRTLYLELQFRGEPLLHKNFGEIVDMLSEKVYLGLSTNGMLLDKKAKDVGKVDFVTVSVDSVGEEYEKLRKGGKWEKLVSGIRALVENVSNTALIELQLIHGIGQEDIRWSVNWWKEWVDKNGYSEIVSVRVIDNTVDATKNAEVGICVDPYSSVSIWYDGTVVSCCYVFGRSEINKSNIYGKIDLEKGIGLREIWSKSKEVRESLWKSEFCKKCKYPNEFLWYFTIGTRLVKKTKRRLAK